MTIKYGLQISSELETRLHRCPVSVRTAIRARLQEIATTAGKSRVRLPETVRKQPSLYLCSIEGFQVSYQVDPETRRVVVLDLGRGPETAEPPAKSLPRR